MTGRTIEPPHTGRSGRNAPRRPAKAATSAAPGARLGLHTVTGLLGLRAGGTPFPGQPRSFSLPR